jgi:hypothetical protein
MGHFDARIRHHHTMVSSQFHRLGVHSTKNVHDVDLDNLPGKGSTSSSHFCR